jgi:four helix bundle protein
LKRREEEMTNDQAPMTNRTPAEKSREFDLAERTAAFGEHVIQFSRRIPQNAISSPIVRQLVRSATSIGANYLEADEAGSKKEFRYRISVCRREARETQYWLRIVVASNPNCKVEARQHWQEARELVLILESIHRKSAATPK